jgi:hypothetical protein
MCLRAQAVLRSSREAPGRSVLRDPLLNRLESYFVRQYDSILVRYHSFYADLLMSVTFLSLVLGGVVQGDYVKALVFGFGVSEIYGSILNYLLRGRGEVSGSRREVSEGSRRSF